MPVFVAATGGNGRIPGLIDHENDGFTVFESAAILMYLAEKYGKFYPSDLKARSEVQQWMFFQMGGVGPMAGQWNHFRKDPDGIKGKYGEERYRLETQRLFGVLDARLAGNKYVVGNEVTIADFCMYP